MTASDISKIVITVAFCQLTCDLLAYWRIYSKELYQRALGAYERAQSKKAKAHKDAVDMGLDPRNPTVTTIASATAATAASGKQKSQNKVLRAAKAYERADQECADACAGVARRHMFPNIWTSILFMMLMRILGTEYHGRIMGILPFTPWGIVRRITGRGLEFGPELYIPEVETKVTDATQAVSFLFLYILCGLSIKFYVNKIFGTSPPKGADGMMALSQSTWGKSVLASAGLDANEFKQD